MRYQLIHERAALDHCERCYEESGDLHPMAVASIPEPVIDQPILLICPCCQTTRATRVQFLPPLTDDMIQQLLKRLDATEAELEYAWECSLTANEPEGVLERVRAAMREENLAC